MAQSTIQLVMIKAIHSEWLKYKRTSIPWLFILPPIVIVLISSYYVSLHDVEENSWIQILDYTNQIRLGVWIPLGWRLIAELTANIEASSGNWRGLRVRDKTAASLYGEKLLGLVIQTLLSTLCLFILMYVAGQFLAIPYVVP